jgi:hypothetical protein
MSRGQERTPSSFQLFRAWHPRKYFSQLKKFVRGASAAGQQEIEFPLNRYSTSTCTVQRRKSWSWSLPVPSRLGRFDGPRRAGYGADPVKETLLVSFTLGLVSSFLAHVTCLPRRQRQLRGFVLVVGPLVYQRVVHRFRGFCEK